MNKTTITRRAALSAAAAASNVVLSSAVAQQAPANPPAAARPATTPRLVSPEVASDGGITFRISAPKANQVAVLADWPGGVRVPMTKDANGIWSVTVGPLQPDMWCYAFDVDGVKTLDPSNMQLRRDTLKVDNLVFAPGPAASLYSVRAVPHGTVSTIWYPSKSLNNKTRRMNVYTPPGYESGSDRYPALYLLHGMGGDEAEWVVAGRAPQILDNLIAQGRAKPMIVVMPNGHSSQDAAPDFVPLANPAQLGGNTEGMSFPDSIAPDIVPFVQKHYRVIANRENRAVMGLSMGGAHALWAGLRNLEHFAWVAGFSGAYIMYNSGGGRSPQGAGSSAAGGDLYSTVFPKLDASANSRLRLLYLSVGLDDFLLQANRQLKTWLKGKGVHFTEEETAGYAHVWAYWRKNLAEVAPLLFQPAGK